MSAWMYRQSCTEQWGSLKEERGNIETRLCCLWQDLFTAFLAIAYISLILNLSALRIKHG